MKKAVGWALLLGMQAAGLAAIDDAQMKRGGEIYLAKCALCHQVGGKGVPPIYPPLAQSDWLMADRVRAIKVLCEGLEGPIVVNGVRYENAMPAQVLNDQEVADVLTYSVNSWGNEAPAFTADEVRAARARSRFPTFEKLLAAAAFQPLPQPPEGWIVREVVQLPEFCTRLATKGDGAPVYVLGQRGTVYGVDPSAEAIWPVIRSADYMDPSHTDVSALGMAQAVDGTLYFVTNVRITKDVEIVQNEVTIWRTSRINEGHPASPKPWLRVRYPFGVGPYNHGVNTLAFGPDGMLYVNSGSRTDGGEPGNQKGYDAGGETEITAAIWRLDPRSDNPRVEVIARGIRNAYGLAWDGAGNLLSVSNGPDANPAEEMDVIEPGKHYGFPYQYADWPVVAGSPYPHTPPPPAGVTFTHPVKNVGPAAGGSRERPLSTFDPHSSPGGMIWCGEGWPERFKGRFLITRFGNLLGAPAAPEDVGFDLLSAKVEKQEDGSWLAKTETVLAPLGRPLDIVEVRPGQAWILDYTRPTDFKSRQGWLPGRIIELKKAQASP
jgi:glucose/arabinose dehydrogenase/mono/diheme cytochrome c family protein